MAQPGQHPAITASAGLRHQVDILLRRYPGAKPGPPTPAQIGDFMFRAGEMAMFHLDCLLRAGTPHDQGTDTAMRDLDGLLIQVEPHIPGVRQSIRVSLEGHLAHVKRSQRTRDEARRPGIAKPAEWDAMWNRAHAEVGYLRGSMTKAQADLAVWRRCSTVQLGEETLSKIRRWKWEEAELSRDTVQMVIDGLTKRFSSP